jgi:DNA-binding NarL/FixJ family response regulator
MREDPITILVADDHAVVREGIRTVLEESEDLEVVAEAADGVEAVSLAKEHGPDVVILDITMPGYTGLQVTELLREELPECRVLILSMHDHPEYVLSAVRAGARGYILKDAGPQEVREAVRAVNRGEEHFAPTVEVQLHAALRGEAARGEVLAQLQELTTREQEVLARVADGRTSREIAEEFGISPRTVETHRESLMRKLEIRTVAGLTRFAIESGLVEE